ncbi:MAG: LysM peptidoglycan-binding domain-containing M23 family metallopeptidase [Omnitrophica bacterium]|nr:LysM peptidoglycan-binding domain-containing M23 family metallopeptidase [Candidatus Omnitrophota bacterium]
MKVDIFSKISKKVLLVTSYWLLVTSLIGCATVSLRPPALPKGIAGIYHRVQKGQTLWRIAKTYGVEMEKISRINRLADTSRIYTGQLIFIPNASERLENLTLKTDFKDRGGDFIWPLKGKVGSFFGMKKDGVKSEGISIQTKKGVSVSAARSGKVAFCSEGLKGYGKTIIIDHLDGYSTVYAQNAKILVKLNQLVKQGQVIARSGASGRVNTPELYFEIRKRHKPQNPFFYLP